MCVKSRLILIGLVVKLVQVVYATNPEFIRPAENKTVIVGEDVTISCHIGNIGAYHVGWIRKDTRAVLAVSTYAISLDPRINVSESDGQTWNLHISNVEEADNGVYSCQINTRPEAIESVTYLKVLVPPSITFDEPDSNFTMVREGKNVTLICRARGNPEPIVTWRREDGNRIEIEDGSSGAKKFVDSFQGEVLKFDNVTRGQMGIYLCTADNNVAPTASNSIKLSVMYVPEVRVASQLVAAPFGSDVKLKCLVESSPTSLNYWTRGKGSILVSGRKYKIDEVYESKYKPKMTFTIRDYNQEDIGTYNCIAMSQYETHKGNIRIYGEYFDYNSNCIILK